MTLPMGERFLLRKVLILRRISDTKSLRMDQLLEHLEEDERLVQEKAPELYFQDDWSDLRRDIDDCVEDGLIEWISPIGSTQTLKRTRLGEQFMKTLEPRLQRGADDMPMSGNNLLDFLASM